MGVTNLELGMVSMSVGNSTLPQRKTLHEAPVVDWVKKEGSVSDL